MKQRTYIAIDLKSFYASVECRERNLDPIDTNLVVADESRTDKTICLAVTPPLKAYGISGRGRLFEVKQLVKNANAQRALYAPKRKLEGSSYFSSELKNNPKLAIDFIIAPPRMAHYIAYSAQIYQIYLKYRNHFPWNLCIRLFHLLNNTRLICLALNIQHQCI